jgi:hypothetical protein
MQMDIVTNVSPYSPDQNSDRLIRRIDPRSSRESVVITLD